jgi:hypothetical protein
VHGYSGDVVWGFSYVLLPRGFKFGFDTRLFYSLQVLICFHSKSHARCPKRSAQTLAQSSSRSVPLVNQFSDPIPGFVPFLLFISMSGLGTGNTKLEIT